MTYIPSNDDVHPPHHDPYLSFIENFIEPIHAIMNTNCKKLGMAKSAVELTTAPYCARNKGKGFVCSFCHVSGPVNSDVLLFTFPFSLAYFHSFSLRSLVSDCQVEVYSCKDCEFDIHPFCPRYNLKKNINTHPTDAYVVNAAAVTFQVAEKGHYHAASFLASVLPSLSSSHWLSYLTCRYSSSSSLIAS